jgi:hypothetical protein
MNQDFFTWIDQALLVDLPSTVQAFNFNLYEGKGEWHVQIVGTGSFSVEDEDWACDEVFTTGENIFVVNRKEAGQGWEDALKYFVALARTYLKGGKHAALLKSKKGVGIGFVDGDLELLYVA